jgi:hypothetical protein
MLDWDRRHTTPCVGKTNRTAGNPIQTYPLIVTEMTCGFYRKMTIVQHHFEATDGDAAIFGEWMDE